jgi:hypothetical protein
MCITCKRKCETVKYPVRGNKEFHKYLIVTSNASIITTTMARKPIYGFELNENIIEVEKVVYITE